MVRLFDGTCVTGTALVLLAVGLAVAALTRDDLPVIGTGAGALLAVTLVGMAACAVGGISQAPELGWTAPGIVLGVVFGLTALVLVAAGAFGWSAVLQPIAGLMPAQLAPATDLRTAVFALAGLIALKWFVALAMAATAR